MERHPEPGISATSPRRGWKIRPYRPQDRKFLEVSLEAHLAEKARLAPLRDLRPSRHWGEPYARYLIALAEDRQGLGLIAEVGGERAGYLLVVPAVPHGMPRWELRSTTFRRPCAAEEMFVLPRFRRTGLGVELLSTGARAFARRGFDWLYAAYHAGHRPEVRIYERFGLRSCSVGVGKWLGSGHRMRRRRLERGSPRPGLLPDAGSRLRLREFRGSDRRFLEESLDAELAERVRHLPSRELTVRRGWGRSYARSLWTEASKPNAWAIVAEWSGTAVGFAFAGIQEHGGWQGRALAFRRACSVSSLYVVPARERLGVGASILRVVEQHARARGCDLIRTFYPEGDRFYAELFRREGYLRNVGVTGVHLSPEGLPLLPPRRSSGRVT